MKSTLTIKKNNDAIIKGLIKAFLFLSTFFVIWMLVTNSAYAASLDPFAAIDNLKTSIATIVEAIGVIAIIIGLLVLGSSLLTHDPAQKITGITAVVVGILLAGVTAIVDKIVNG